MAVKCSCHCEAVRLEVDAEPEGLLQCNCSSCRRFGAIHWYVPSAKIRLLTEGLALTSWQDRELGSSHQFCRTCGASVLRTGYPNGVVALNAALIEEVDIFALEIERFDGRVKLEPGVRR